MPHRDSNRTMQPPRAMPQPEGATQPLGPKVESCASIIVDQGDRTIAYRIVESLTELGLSAEVRQVADSPARLRRDRLIILTSAVAVRLATISGGLEALRALRERTDVLAVLLTQDSLDEGLHRITRAWRGAGVDAVLDIGLCDRRDQLPPKIRSYYHFLFSGLTTAEINAIATSEPSDSIRPIPWSIIGQASSRSVRLVDRLMSLVDPRGFVHIPDESDGPGGLKREQRLAVLRRTRFHVWCPSSSDSPMDAEHFHLSLLAGGVPLQLQNKTGCKQPFDDLCFGDETLPLALVEMNFQDARAKFRADFLARPSLKSELAGFLHAIDLPAADSTIGPVVARVMRRAS